MNSAQIANPFSARFVRPDAIPFLGDRKTVYDAVDQFSQNRFIGQIVGPHGCGKTCLANAIQAQLASRFGLIRRITIRNFHQVILAPKINRQHRSPVSVNSSKETIRQLLIVDGFERLPRLHRWLLVQNAHREGGLLITSHARIRGIPVVAELQPDFETFRNVVSYLAPNHHFLNDNLQEVFVKYGGDFRESLMRLYDEVQSASQGSSRPSTFAITLVE